MNITIPMYEKGRSFIMAAGLVKAYEGHRLVYLHLLCQGFENITKAILLHVDYQNYGPQLRIYGHNLQRLFAEVQAVYSENILSTHAIQELKHLNQFYMHHQLRYGSESDTSPESLQFSSDCLHSELIGLLPELNHIFS